MNLKFIYMDNIIGHFLKIKNGSSMSQIIFRVLKIDFKVAIRMYIFINVGF